MSKYDDYDDSSGTAPPELPNLVFPALDICGRLPADHGDPLETAVTIACALEAFCKQLLKDAVLACGIQEHWQNLPAGVARGKHDIILPRFLQIAFRSNVDGRALLNTVNGLREAALPFLDAATSTILQSSGLWDEDDESASNTPSISLADDVASPISSAASGWQRRKDDVITEVHFVQLLQRVHPMYRLPNDSLFFLTSITRCLLHELLLLLPTLSSADAALSAVLQGKLVRDAVALSQECILTMRGTFAPSGAVKITFQVQRSIDPGQTKSFTIGRTDRIGDCIAALCTTANLARKEFVFLYNGHPTQDVDTPASLSMPRAVTVFVLEQKWWNHHIRDEARRGHLTSNKTNEEALKHLRKNAVSKVASSASIVSTPLSRARHVDTSVGKDSAPPSSGYSPIASPILPARRAVMSEEDPYGDDEFESEVDVKPSLQLLRNKKSFSRQRKVDEVPVERVASLDKLVVLGADASPTAHLRGRASTRRVQARESSQDSSPGVASSLSSHSRQPSHDVESVILPSGVRVSHRTGFGYVPAPLPGGKPRACSPPDSTAHSPSHRRLLRTPLDGQLPDLGALSRVTPADQRSDYGHRYQSPLDVVSGQSSSHTSASSPSNRRRKHPQTLTTLPVSQSHPTVTTTPQAADVTSPTAVHVRQRRNSSRRSAYKLDAPVGEAFDNVEASPPVEVKAQLQLLKKRGHGSQSPLRRRAQLDSLPLSVSEELPVPILSSPRVPSLSEPVRPMPDEFVKLPVLNRSTSTQQSSTSGTTDSLSDQLQILKKKRGHRRNTSTASAASSTMHSPSGDSNTVSTSSLPALTVSPSVSSITADVAQQLLFASEESISALQETLFRVEKLRRQILASRLPPVSLPTASTPSLPLSPDVEDAAGLHASLLAVQESAKRSESVLKSTITVIGEVEAPHAPPVTKHLIPVYQEDPPVTLPPPSPPRTSTPERQHVPVTSQLTLQVPASPERVAAMDSPLVVVSSIAGSPSASVVLSPATEQALLEFEEKGQPSAISLPPTSPPKPKGAVLVEPFTFEPLAPTSNAPVPVGAPSPIPGGSLGLQHSPGRLHPTVPVIPHFAIPKSSVSTPTGEGRISPVNPLVSTPHRTSPMSGLNNVLTLNTGIATLPDRAKVSRSISASALPSPSSAAVPSPHVKSLITSNSALSVVAVLTPSAVHVNTPSVSSGDASTGELRLSSPRLHTMDVPPIGISSLSHSLRPERTESVGTEGKPFYWGTELKQAVLSSRVPSTDTHQPPPILSPALHNTPPDLPFPSLQASLVESASSFVIPPSEEAPPLDGIGLGPLLSIELTEDDGGSSRQPSVDINDDGEQDADANGDAPIVPFESPRTFTSEDQQFTPVLQTSSVVAPSPSVPAAAVVSLDPDPVPLDDVIAAEDTAESAPQPIVPIPIRQAHVPIRNPRNVVAVSKAAPQFGDDTFG